MPVEPIKISPAPEIKKPSRLARITCVLAGLFRSAGASGGAGSLALFVLLVLGLCFHSAAGRGVFGCSCILGEHCRATEKREAERSDHYLFH